MVRVSGRDLRLIIDGILGIAPKARHATRASFLDASANPIDDGVAVYFPAPASYTGEDVLELHGHGGAVVMQMVLRRCMELGARLAEPGEFTRRAYLNDKLDLAQAEGVADVIDAATEAAARCALRSLRGEFSLMIKGLRDRIIGLRVRVEASLDFPDEDVEATPRNIAHPLLLQLRAELAHTLARGRQGSVLRAGLQVVLAGRPNVGKSSLLNCLAGQDLAIVTEIPGTTRDTVRQTIQIDGVPMNIIDTAGLRDTADRIETIGISRTWEAISSADVLLLLVDAATGVTESDNTIMERVPTRLSRVIVHNKIDLVGRAPGKAETGTETNLWVSAKTGAGLGALRTTLLSLAGWQSTGESVFMARERHLAALKRAAECVDRAEMVIERTELFAEELRLAQSELDSILGEFAADDLLGEIFSHFCIGK